MSRDEQGTESAVEDFTTLINNVPSSKVKDKGPPWWRSQRYFLAYLLFGGMMNIFFQRMNFSIAILCMVNHTATDFHGHDLPNASKALNDNPLHDRNSHVKNYSFYDQKLSQSNSNKYSQENVSLVFQIQEPAGQDNNNSTFMKHEYASLENIYPETQKRSVVVNDFTFASTTAVNDKNILKSNNFSSFGCEAGRAGDVMEDGPLLWDKELQGLLLGAVYWTYLIAQIPANFVVRRAKKKTIVLCSMIVMSIMTLLIHVAALLSPWAVFAVRLVQGICTAMVIIAMYGMWGHWAPQSERASLITLAMSGQNLGNIIVFPLSAVLCKYGFMGGWPSIFYVFGGVGFIWIVLFFFLTDESPSTQRFITEEEKTYIISAISHKPQTRQNADMLTLYTDCKRHLLTYVTLHRQHVPWIGIITSSPFWGIVIGQFSFTWGLLLIFSTLPQYMYEVLKFDIRSNGIFTMLPYIAQLIVTQAAGSISDLVIRKKFLTVLWTRRLCVLIANLVPSALLAAMSFLDHSQAGLAITLLVIAVGTSGFALSGLMVSPYDIAPRFATEMMTIINTFATLPGILTPYIVAAVTKDQTREQWQIVFFITSGIYVIGALCFCLMSQGVVQPWAKNEEQCAVDMIVVDKDEKKVTINEKEEMLNGC